ncbi:MAG TPA: Hpt domain-containing protein [archaeon]|nr:Hpt domain-containing protein [archaeon]
MELDGEALHIFIEDSQDNMSGIENDLLAIEAGGENIDNELVNKVFRAVHSVKGSAGYMGLKNIKDLAHGMENIMNLIRNKQMAPKPDVISVLLESADVLNGLIKDVRSSDKADITGQLEKLKNTSLSGDKR